MTAEKTSDVKIIADRLDAWGRKKSLENMSDTEKSTLKSTLRQAAELLMRQDAAIRKAIELTDTDVIRVRPSERATLIDALREWNEVVN